MLVSGLYGTGKSSVIEEIATTLEASGVAYGALDLDWLFWYHVPGQERSERISVLLANLASVTLVYLQEGVTRFVMAWSLREPGDLSGLRATVPFPVRAVELVVPFKVIEARLAGSVTTGRADDLSEARRWSRQGLGVGLGDIQISADRPVGMVASDVLEWVGWL